MTQMMLIDERIETVTLDERLFAAFPEGDEFVCDTFADAPDDDVLDEVLTARCGSL